MYISSARRSIFALLAALLVFLPLNAATQTPSSGAPAAGDVEKGKQAFSANGCNGCHGDEGEGAMGPEIAGIKRSFSEFTSILRKPKGAMPPFDSATVPDSQLADIYAFLKSLASAPESGSGPAADSSSDASPAAASTPLAPAASPAQADAQHGKIIFASSGCDGCHGRVGQGARKTAAPSIAPPSLPFLAFAAYVRRPAGKMPPYTSKALSDADLADIFAFLRSTEPPAPARNIPPPKH